MKIHACRSCGAPELSSLLDLGRQPLANRLPGRADEVLAAYRLHLVQCGVCSLVQIDETVDPELLFSDYSYFSSYADTMLEHAKDLAIRLCAEQRLGADDLVVELASNDGYLLRNYVERAIPVLGVEPARNVAEVARRAGVDTEVAFFGRRVAERIRDERGTCRILHAHNVLAHVADINDFVAGIAALLDRRGLAVLEFPYLTDMLERVAFDTIYHEHLAYFSLRSVTWLFERHDLQIVDVERVPIHGGSLRIFVRHRGVETPSASVGRLLKEEEAGGGALRRFAELVRSSLRELVDFVERARREGASVAGYGAAAKATVLLNAAGLNAQAVDFIADRSPHKQGRFVPGVGVEIVPAEELSRRRPDYCILFAWNFAGEIRRQQGAYERAGGRFVVPLPKVSVLEPRGAAA